MIERMRQQYLRKLGAIFRDPARSATHPQPAVLNEEPGTIPTNEVPAERYLATLSDIDRHQVLDFLAFVPTLSATVGKVRLGVNAVGSTVRPPEENFRPIDDIDLRILNSAPKDSEERKEVVATLRNTVRDYLDQRGVKYLERDETVTQARKSAFIHFYNDDPSFLTQPEAGLPLHFSISGADNPDLDEYLKEERRQGFHYSPLYLEYSAGGETVAGSLAAAMLAESVRKGNVINIPSLGITITKDDLTPKSE